MVAKGIDEAVSFRSTPEYAALLRESSDKNYPHVAPYQLSIGVWGHCNSRCGYCPNWTYKNSAPTTERLLPIFHEARELGVSQVLFSGGEPTLRPDLIGVMSSAKSMGFEILLITNGLRLDREYIKQLGDIGCKKIGLSLDTLDTERYRAIRGVELGKARRALDLLTEAATLQPSDYHVSVCVTISRQNSTDLISMMEQVHSRYLAIQYQPVNFDTTTPSSVRQRFWPGKSEIAEIRASLQTIIEKKEQGFAISNRLEFLKAIPEYFETGTYYPKRCFTPFAQIIVDQRMNLKPCWAMDSVGVIGKGGKSLREIWYSAELATARLAIRESKCPGCTYSCHLSKNYTEF